MSEVHRSFSSHPPPATAGPSVPMAVSIAGSITTFSRPKGQICGKDNWRGNYASAVAIKDEVMVGYSGSFIYSARGLQIRDRHALALIRELDGAAPPHALHADGQFLLSSGPYNQGDDSCTHLVRVNPLEIVDTLPVRQPYSWLIGNSGDVATFVGMTPVTYPPGSSPQVSPQVVAQHPYLEHLVQQSCRLVWVNLNSRQADFLVDNDLSDDGWTRPGYLVPSWNGETVYYATTTVVGAISVTGRSFQWRCRLGRFNRDSVYSIYALALSKDGRFLAVGAYSSEGSKARNFTILNAHTGKLIVELPLTHLLSKCDLNATGNSTITTLGWHSSGWVAVGTRSGLVAHIAVDGSFRAYRGANIGINALAFLPGEKSLLVAGREKQFRIWALLDDEC